MKFPKISAKYRKQCYEVSKVISLKCCQQKKQMDFESKKGQIARFLHDLDEFSIIAGIMKING
ncbi:hypothetical protein C4F49_17840 [Sphingobacterium sp. KB22]|uniref:Uncharacterized protein n=1 Tax=Sphingobacterium hungaricum TaxID=2082723 RepID=A0A928UYU1_9SPHI|nr:hypothetical protein [Sphingobacterium hungaricum]